MLSSRGAITTNVAIVECASGQNTRGKEVFLLSELEKVWVAVCILVRRHLLEGVNPQIPGLGSFWTEERCLLNDTVHYRQRFCARQVKFGVNPGFSMRYGMDSAKAPLERPNLSYVKIRMADVVGVCAVPAHTAAMALKEFIMYLGEGLYCGRTFQLSFPGVATLILKKERFMLTVDAELQGDLYDADSRRWPSEIQTLGRSKLEDERMPGSAASSRPSSQASRTSLRRPASATTVSSAATTAAASSSVGSRPVFNPAAPKDRLFADIEKETMRRREAERLRQQEELAEAQQQERVDRMIDGYNCYAVDEDSGMTDTAHVHGRPHADAGCTITYRPATRESVYDWANEDEGGRRGTARERDGPAQEPDEPEVEVIEVTYEEDDKDGAGAPRSAPGKPRGKDPLLESILRQEEVFSRPISRYRDSTAHTSARDLIYASPSAEDVTTTSKGGRHNAARTRRHASPDSRIAVPPQHSSFPTAADIPAVPQFGRKRHVEYHSTNDSVGALLKDAAVTDGGGTRL